MGIKTLQNKVFWAESVAQKFDHLIFKSEIRKTLLNLARVALTLAFSVELRKISKNLAQLPPLGGEGVVAQASAEVRTNHRKKHG